MLSPSTQALDRGEKFFEYFALTDAIRIDSLDISLSLADIYRKISFDTPDAPVNDAPND